MYDLANMIDVSIRGGCNPAVETAGFKMVDVVGVKPENRVSCMP